MNYNDLTKEQLIDHINSIERLNLELLKEKELETKLEYAWSGNLGHWYWDIITNSVTFNPLKVKALGYTMEEIPEPIPYQFFTDKLHPEDYQNTMQTMLDHLHGKSNVYEVEYRIQTKDGEYKWFYDRGKITQYDNNGKPVFLAGIVFDITEKKDTLLELENKNRILTEMSSIDGLTKIINHRTLIGQLKLEIIEAARTDSPLSIVLFDIDNFKKVNDSKGHVA
ncbi:MAG: PAS domain-containing protein, partial [Eubacteriales bacterium]|nr:PAS domain-containing protein [Eubacteriales bacterium]